MRHELSHREVKSHADLGGCSPRDTGRRGLWSIRNIVAGGEGHHLFLERVIVHPRGTQGSGNDVQCVLGILERSLQGLSVVEKATVSIVLHKALVVRALGTLTPADLQSNNLKKGAAVQDKGGPEPKEKLKDHSLWAGMGYAISVLLLLMLVNSCANQHPAVAADGKRVITFDPLDNVADPGRTSPEDMAVLADCSVEVKERLRMMAGRGADAARRLTNAERNRQQSRGGDEP